MRLYVYAIYVCFGRASLRRYNYVHAHSSVSTELVKSAHTIQEICYLGF